MIFLYNSNLVGKRCSIVDDVFSKYESCAKLNDDFQDYGRWTAERMLYFVNTWAKEHDVTFKRIVVEIAFVNEDGKIIFLKSDGKLIEYSVDSMWRTPVYLLDL